MASFLRKVVLVDSNLHKVVVLAAARFLSQVASYLSQVVVVLLAVASYLSKVVVALLAVEPKAHSPAVAKNALVAPCNLVTIEALHLVGPASFHRHRHRQHHSQAMTALCSMCWWVQLAPWQSG